MSEVKHTPGPWFITGRMTKFIEARIGGGILQEIAGVGPTEADGGYGPTQEANARLIAAAPELLEALEAAVECGMVPNTSANEGGASRYARQVVVADMIRAAIAKATGETK